MPRDMPSTTREFAQLEESMAHERKMSIGIARLSAHAASIRAEHINGEASAVAAAETAKIMARVAGEDASKKKGGDDDDFVWPVLGTKLPTHRRRHVKHWKETHFAPEPVL